jgi:hypothetical protein
MTTQIIASSDEVVAQKDHGNRAMSRFVHDALTGRRVIGTLHFDKGYTLTSEDLLGGQAVSTQ